MEPAQPADPMDVVPAAQSTPKGPSMMPRAVAARRLAVQKNDQHIVLVKEAVAKALADYKAGEDKRTAGGDSGSSNDNQEIDLRDELLTLRENQEVILKTQLEDTAEILTAVQLVTRTQIMLKKRFDTHTRLMDALNEKQSLNECDTGHWSWIRDLKDELAHFHELHEISKKAYEERRAREAKNCRQRTISGISHTRRRTSKHSRKHPNRDYGGSVGRPKKEKGKGKQPHRIKFMGEYTSSETEDYYSFFARRFATRRPHHRRAHARESPHVVDDHAAKRHPVLIPHLRPCATQPK